MGLNLCKGGLRCRRGGGGGGPGRPVCCIFHLDGLNQQVAVRDKLVNFTGCFFSRKFECRD